MCRASNGLRFSFQVASQDLRPPFAQAVFYQELS